MVSRHPDFGTSIVNLEGLIDKCGRVNGPKDKLEMENPQCIHFQSSSNGPQVTTRYPSLCSEVDLCVTRLGTRIHIG